MFAFFAWLALAALTLLFVASAKQASYSKEEIEAEYDEQYRALNSKE